MSEVSLVDGGCLICRRIWSTKVQGTKTEGRESRAKAREETMRCEIEEICEGDAQKIFQKIRTVRQENAGREVVQYKSQERITMENK